MHDAAGALLARYDANGNAASTFVYDALGRLLGHTDALGQTSEFRRDEGDRPVEVVAPNGALTRYVYDDIGNLLLEQGPDRGTLKFSHDASGNIVSIEEADGVIVSYRYDALNRLAGIDYPGEEEDVRFVYDACNNGAGRLCEVRDFSGTTRYVYDPFGRVVEQTKQELGVVYRTAYEYDAHDRVTVLHYPDGHRLERLRDAVGRVHTVLHTAPASEPTMPHRATDQAPAAETIVAGRRYRADGLLTAQVYGNGLSEWRAYDLQGRPVDYALGSLAHQRYVHDPNGNPLVIDGGTRSSRYAYDGVDRLVAEYHEAVDAAGAEVIEYDYDANGNRRGRAGDGEFTHYDFEPQSNRLTAVNGAARVRDAGGRLLNDTAAVLEFVYDNAGRVAALYRGGALAARYVYDAFGRRTRKTTPAGTVVYHYDLRGRLIQETGADGSRRRTYFWDDDVPLAQLAPPRDPRPLPATGADAPGEAHHAAGGAQTVADARPEYPESARWPETRTVAALTYLHTDHLGTPRLGTDADGALAWRWRGDAFGEAGPEVERALVNLRFPGQYFDAESGLHYNGYRYYDSRSGRYISSDPIGLAGGLNTYVYAGARPTAATDPTGLFVSSAIWRLVGPLLKRTPEEVAYAGKVADAVTGTAVFAAGPEIPRCVDIAGARVDIGPLLDLLQGYGGLSAIGLAGYSVAGLYGAGAGLAAISPAFGVPLAIAGVGSLEIGQSFNNVYERQRGNSLGSDLYDLFNHQRLFKEHP